MEYKSRWTDDILPELKNALIGRKIVQATMNADPNSASMTLDNGDVILISKYESECCSAFGLSTLSTTDNIITDIVIEDTDEGEGEYKAWVRGIFDNDTFNIITGEGDASNGYYLHGFCLPIKVCKAVRREKNA